MNKIYKKLIVLVLWLFSSFLGMFIFLQLLTIIDIRLLKAGYLEGSGVSQFIRTYMGIPLLLLAAILWMALVILSFDKYNKAMDKGNLCKIFLFITAIELFCFPIVVAIQHIAFPIRMLFIDWIIAGGSFILGVIALYFSRNRVIE